MNNSNQVLLASHGSDGAMAAEQMAIRMCCAQGARLHHLIVVPTLWEGMTGDDWLNNGSTRDTFRRYLETELGKEVDEHIARVKGLAEQQGLYYTNEIVLGEPDECLLKAASKDEYELIVVGSARPKGIPGLRSRMMTQPVARSLQTPVLIVPYPEHE
jgi:nucleotide-binding universal stress UspA family protein